MTLPIEISRDENAWKVWFGTLASDRERSFATPEAAEEFALAKFADQFCHFVWHNGYHDGHGSWVYRAGAADEPTSRVNKHSHTVWGSFLTVEMAEC